MTMRSKYLFVTFQEFAEWLPETTKHLGASVISYRGPRVPLKQWDGTEEQLAESEKVFVATDRPDLVTVSPETVPSGGSGGCSWTFSGRKTLAS